MNVRIIALDTVTSESNQSDVVFTERDGIATVDSGIYLTAGHDYVVSVSIQSPLGDFSDESNGVIAVAETNGVVTAQLSVSGDTIILGCSLSNNYPIDIEIETNIDGCEWVRTAIRNSDDLPFFLRKNRIEQLLDSVHDYRYSDGQTRHIVARLRRLNTSDEWVYAEIDVALNSVFFPQIIEWSHGIINNCIVHYPDIAVTVASGYRYEFFVAIDGGEPRTYKSMSSIAAFIQTDYLKSVPDSAFNNAQHYIDIGVSFFKGSEKIHSSVLGGKSVFIPSLPAVMPPIKNNGCVAFQEYDESWSIRVNIPDIPNVIQAHTVVNQINFTADVGLAGTYELLLSGINLEKDGKMHRLSYSYYYEMFNRKSNVVYQNVEVISMAANAPSNIVLSFKKVRDTITGLQTGYEITARLSFEQSKLKILCSVDNGAFTDCTFDVLSNYPPMIKINGVNVPRDAYSHPVIFKMWHSDEENGDSDVVTTDAIVAVFDMAPPPQPTAVSALVVRDRRGSVPDHVRVSWASDYDVNIVVLDDQGKKRSVGIGAEADSELIVENSSRFGLQDGSTRQYRFGVQSTNKSASSAIVYAEPVQLTTTNASVVAQTPDDIAGTAQYLSNAQFIDWLKTEFTAVDPSTVANVFAAAMTKIKDVVSRGGAVTLSDTGIFKASWTPEKTVFKNGQYINIPAVRNAEFSLSLGFQKGTRLGQVMTDTEAAQL